VIRDVDKGPICLIRDIDDRLVWDIDERLVCGVDMRRPRSCPGCWRSRQGRGTRRFAGATDSTLHCPQGTLTRGPGGLFGRSIV
jgi:hypothetical protein